MTSIPDFEGILKQAMGLDAASVGTSTVQRAVQNRMAALGLDTADAYLAAVQDSPRELQELIETVVVPETWFFRDSDAFALMVDFVTKERLIDRPLDPVKLLSLPCSTGEEPYSMAMALSDAGLSQHQIKVDAVDISKLALDRAQEAVYGRNSFRGADVGYRDRHFCQEKHGYALSDAVKRSVHFHTGNLALGLFPPLPAPYDVVFCRNLLIYFDRATQEAAMKTLSGLLAPSGLLFVGPAEAYLATSCGFSAVSGKSSFALRKTPAAAPKAAARVPARALPTAATKARALPPGRVARPNTEPKTVTESKIIKPQVPDGLADARRLADLGRLQEAIQCCERSIAQDGPSADAFYLIGVARDASGDRKDASHYYRRTLYLDPGHVDALSHLAMLMETQGDPAAARLLRERAQRASLKTSKRED